MTQQIVIYLTKESRGFLDHWIPMNIPAASEALWAVASSF